MSIVELNRAEENGEEITVLYNLTHKEAKDLCIEFIGTTNNIIDGQFGCYLIKSDSKFSNLGRFVEVEVFRDKFKNEPETLQEEYEPYESASSFFVVVDHEAQKPVGVMRLIENSPSGLKSLNDLKQPLDLTPEQVFSAYGIDPDKCVDIGTLGLLPEYRQYASLQTLMMYRSLYTTVLDNPRISHVVAVIETSVDKLLKTYKFPFHPILDTEPFSYLDSSDGSRPLLSQAMWATTAEYRAQTAYWLERWTKQSEVARLAGNEKTAKSKEFGASVLNMLVGDGKGVDELIGFDVTATKL